MKINTSRFGLLEVEDADIIHFRDGLLAFEDLQKFFIVDPSDETLILWLQSADRPEVAFPILEPKLFKDDYKVRLSGNELRLLEMDSTSNMNSLVYCILTIPSDVTEITANLKAPIVINGKMNLGKQVVLQENEYGVKYAMYKDLVAMMMKTSAMRSASQESAKGLPVTLSLREARSQVEVSAL
ncbi:MAG: flagellar assembly protein FliW [Oligoflexia bacterium]|nr:flagellar assembly protein FliW [Oligoflexia bacterium]